MKNKDYAKEYRMTRGLKEGTEQRIRLVLEHYSTYQGLSIEELLNEADTEEEQGIRWKKRTLKKRLINYMNYCKETMLLSSAKTYFIAVKGFYNHHEITIGPLPRWNNKNANVPEPITPDKMLTKETIREALKVANPVMRCIILTEASSGMTRSDVLSLTVKDFVEATKDYHNCNTIQETVKTLLDNDNDIIPTFKLRRAKNNKYFITFISPEATVEICKYLILRDKRNHKYHRPLLTDIDRLFKIHRATYIDKFTEINKQLNDKKAGTYGQFRGHNLRKFHATQLEKCGMSRYHINTLQGKSNNSVDDVYFITDTEKLRNEYLRALQGVLIYTEVKEINQYSPEYQKLELENKQFKEREDRLNKILDRLEQLEK